MRKFALLCLVCLVAGSVLPAFAQSTDATLTVVTHDSFNVTEDVLTTFEQQTGISVRILRSGDAGTMINQVILTKDNPLGDVVYGLDNTFLTRALDAGLFVPYESPLLDSVPDDFKLDPEYRVTPVDYGDVCLNYDATYFQEHDLALPESLADLTQPDYQDLLVVENAASSSPGLAFLLSTIANFGTPDDDLGADGYTYLDYWRDLVANGVLIADDWSSAYYGEFSGSSGEGQRPLVVSYASSPPAEVYFAEDPPAEAPTGSIVAPQTCFRQIELVGILNGTPNTEAAQQFVDFMLSLPFQEDMPLQMFVFPVNTEAHLPEIFTEYAQIPDEPVSMTPEAIGAHRTDWLQAWAEVALH
jgi:thiamine transport system substrate-binding protein